MNKSKSRNKEQDRKFAVTTEFRAMGTDVTIDLVVSDPEHAKTLCNSIEELFEEYEEVFSRFRPSSELSVLNARCGECVRVSTLLFSAIEAAVEFHSQTSGYFDPRIIGVLEGIGYDQDFHGGGVGLQEHCEPAEITGPLHGDIILDPAAHTVEIGRRIDLSGIAKSITLKAAAQLLRDAAIADFIVDAGGDMVIGGVSGTGGKWQIGLEDIADEALLLALSDQSLATSGITRRQWCIGQEKYHHLINPKRAGKFSFDTLSITVVDDDIVRADVWAKTLFLMGRDARAYAEKNNIAALFLDSHKKIYATKHIEHYML